MPNELLGGRSDAAVALAETHYFVHTATDGGANGPANVGHACGAGAASSARAKSAAGRAVAKEAIGFYGKDAALRRPVGARRPYHCVCCSPGRWPALGCAAVFTSRDGPQGRGYTRY